MKLYLIVSTILAASLFACTTSRCKVDKEFVEDYQRHVQIIINEKRGDSTDIDVYRNTLTYFYKVTGFLPRAEYSSTIGYRDEFKYEQDINTLNDWLKKNRCHFSMKLRDSLLHVRFFGEH
jgi:hypothetical protein